MGLFRAKWTDKIHEEWISNLLERRPDLTLQKLTRTKSLINEAVPDCLVSDYENLIDSIQLPDPNDRHVLAAAIKCNADAIVTFNLKDFPSNLLKPYGIEPQHPDEFFYHQFGLNEAHVLNAVRRCRTRLKKPPKTVGEYLLTLERCELPQTVDRLRDYSEII